MAPTFLQVYALADRPRDASCPSVIVSIVQYVERNLLLLVTSASVLPLHTITLCSLFFGVVVHAGCDKQDSLMRGDLCGKRTSTLTAVRSTVDC